MASARASMIRCFCPPERLVPLSETMRIQFFREGINKFSQLSGINGFLQADSSVTRSLKRNIFADAHVEDDTVLENKSNVTIKIFLIIIS